MNRQRWQAARFIVLLLLVVGGAVLSQWQWPAPEPAGPAPAATETVTLVRDVTLHDEAGKVVFQGDIELGESLARIDAQRRLRFRNDGSVFQNREQRLPMKPTGYYREWVHPTPGLPGPGPQRIVTGSSGEAYYTPDHYASFQRIR